VRHADSLTSQLTTPNFHSSDHPIVCRLLLISCSTEDSRLIWTDWARCRSARLINSHTWNANWEWHNCYSRTGDIGSASVNCLGISVANMLSWGYMLHRLIVQWHDCDTVLWCGCVLNQERQIAVVRELLNDKNNRTLLADKDRERLAFLTTDNLPSPYEASGRRSVLFAICCHGNEKIKSKVLWLGRYWEVSLVLVTAVISG